jgi:predicted transcriptional regulator
MIRRKRRDEADETHPSVFDQEQYEKHKSAVAIIMGHFFLRHLNLLYREFEGDLILPVVLGEIAHHNIFRFYSCKGDSIEVHEQLVTYPERMRHLAPTNAFSISHATGIPRETVRRKIEKLEKKGWVVKNKKGDVLMTETVSEHFTKDFNKKLLSELLGTTESIKRLLGRDWNKTTQQGEGYE